MTRKRKSNQKTMQESWVIKVAKRFGIRNFAHNQHTWNGTFTKIAQDRTRIASTSFTLQNLWKALTMVQNPLVRENCIDLFILLFLIAITTWGLLWCSLHVLSLHSSGSSPTKWAREGKVNVLLAINPDHEWWNVHDLLANPVECKGVTEERNEIKYYNSQSGGHACNTWANLHRQQIWDVGRLSLVLVKMKMQILTLPSKLSGSIISNLYMSPTKAIAVAFLKTLITLHKHERLRFMSPEP